MVDREKFDREVEWPPPRDDEGRERSHPDMIPDLEVGPFKKVMKDRGRDAS